LTEIRWQTSIQIGFAIEALGKKTSMIAKNFCLDNHRTVNVFIQGLYLHRELSYTYSPNYNNNTVD
jgi:hypothetical protein